jgi:hypothetical protein
VAERRPTRSPNVYFEYPLDRLLGAKLAQAYQVLVPDKRRAVGATQEVSHEQAGSYLRSGIVGPPEGRTLDQQPNYGADGVRREPRVCGEGHVDRSLLRTLPFPAASPLGDLRSFVLGNHPLKLHHQLIFRSQCLDFICIELCCWR